MSDAERDALFGRRIRAIIAQHELMLFENENDQWSAVINYGDAGREQIFVGDTEDKAVERACIALRIQVPNGDDK